MEIWFNFVFASPSEINMFFKNAIQSGNQEPKKNVLFKWLSLLVFIKVLNKFVSNITVDCSTDCRTYYFTIPYFGIDSRRFLNRLSKNLKSKFNVKIVLIIKHLKLETTFN